jgi:hypothetical protein
MMMKLKESRLARMQQQQSAGGRTLGSVGGWLAGWLG